MANNTRNPIPSSNPLDFIDNSENLDLGMNSTEETFIDRLGRPRNTYQAFHNLVINAKNQIDPTVAAAKQAVNSTAQAAIGEMEETAANLGGDLNNKHYSTYAEMAANPQTRDNVVGIVDSDPDKNLNGFYYWSAQQAEWIYFEDQPITGTKLSETVSQVTPPVKAFSVSDELGFDIFSAETNGDFGTLTSYLSHKGLINPTFNILEHPGSQVILVDAYGFIGADLLTPAATQVVTGASMIEQRNAANLAASAAVRGEFNSEVQRPVAKYNHFLTFGQSLSTGNETWPALSKAPYGGSLMLGDSTRPSGRYVAAFNPLDLSILQPMKAVVQSDDGSKLLTDAEVAALEPGAGNEGEAPDIGMVNFARKQFLQYHNLAADPSRIFVSSNCGVSGRTVEQLSKGASPEFYLRLLQAAQKVKAIADTEGSTYAIPAIIWMQGEFNYIPDRGGDTTKEGYKAKLLAQSKIWKSEIISGVAGQEAPPAIITYQTGAAFTRDNNDLSIGMAQWELSQEQPNWYMASPYYPYTDKGGHLDPNGSRWLGMQLGKVLHRVVTLGQDWKPLSPRNVTIHEKEILIDFHVPCPPLAWDKPYVGLVATDYIDKGFRVKDSSGTLAIKTVEIVAETIVRIELVNTPGADLLVQYATLAASGGNGCLRDSDPTVAMNNYQYSEGIGQYSAANIPALVDKPYPLYNWCIAFSLKPENV